MSTIVQNYIKVKTLDIEIYVPFPIHGRLGGGVGERVLVVPK